MLHVIGVVVVTQLTVIPESYDQVVWVVDFVGGDDAWPDRCKGVERFAKPACERRCRPRTAALLAGGDVDHGGVTKDSMLPVPGAHHFCGPLDHQRKLSLTHENPGHREFRQHDGVARPDNGIGVFHEHIERTRLALGVFPVVRDAGKNFSRARQRWPQAGLIERDGASVLGECLQRRTQVLEMVDNALHHQLRRVILRCRCGDIDNASLSKQTRQNVRAG